MVLQFDTDTRGEVDYGVEVSAPMLLAPIPIRAGSFCPAAVAASTHFLLLYS